MLRRLSILAANLTLCGCAVWPVGEDPAGAELKLRAAPVFDALAKFHHDHGIWPASLPELTPRYLPVPLDKRLFFDKKSESLGFTYSPTWPQMGQTSCSANVRSQKWSCVGYI